MNAPIHRSEKPAIPPIDTFIRILLLSGLIAWCLMILAPFATTLLWAVILAVAVHPLFEWMARRMGGRKGFAATVLVLTGLAIVAVPGYFIGDSLVVSVQKIRAHFSAADLHVPQLPADWYEDSGLRRMIADRWPKSDGVVADFMRDHSEQVKNAAGFLIEALGSFLGDILRMILALIIMGLLLANSKQGGAALERFLSRVIGERGPSMVELAQQTIRNVARGILGVAFVQSVLFALGVFMAGVPGAGLLTVAALLLAMIQVGVGPLAIGVIIYAWATMNTLPAGLLTVWMLITMVSDNMVKPILLGRGAAVPMPVIFLGSIGGFILSGFIGLFTGAVVLGIGYRLIYGWMGGSHESAKE
jgi:predicted PurR-regulated permease PerM